MARCRQGDEHAWHELMETLTPMILGMCRRRGFTREESFDIFGTVSAELVTGLHRLKSNTKIAGFVATITRRRISDYVRQLSTTTRGLLDEVVEPVDETTDPERHLEDERRSQALAEAMLQLSTRDRRLIQALFLDEPRPTYEEIAAEFNMPVASIGPTRARSLDRLHRILKRRGWDFHLP